MLKVLLIKEGREKIPSLTGAKILATVTPGKAAIDAMLKHDPDLVVCSKLSAKMLNAILVKSDMAVRESISARTRQGLQLVPINDIYYFQAADKYVNAYHKGGELLIEDAIAKLEQEFSDNFVRVHRNTLVAINRIECLKKNQQGQSVIKLRGLNIELIVSRRQLPRLRKILLC